MRWPLERVTRAVSPGTIKGRSATGSCSGASKPETNQILGLVSPRQTIFPTSPRPCSRRATRTAQLPTGTTMLALRKPVRKAPEQGFLGPMPGPADWCLALAAQIGQCSPTPGKPHSHLPPKTQLKGGLEAPSGPRAHGPLAPLLRFPKSYAKVRPHRKVFSATAGEFGQYQPPRRHRILR